MYSIFNKNVNLLCHGAINIGPMATINQSTLSQGILFSNNNCIVLFDGERDFSRDHHILFRSGVSFLLQNIHPLTSLVTNTFQLPRRICTIIQSFRWTTSISFVRLFLTISLLFLISTLFHFCFHKNPSNPGKFF